MKRFFTFFLFLFTIQFNGYSTSCGTASQSLGAADGTFESLAGIASGFALNGAAGGLNGASWIKRENDPDSWLTPLPNVTEFSAAAGMSASPDGGIFAAIYSEQLNSIPSYKEAFSTTVSNLTIGKKYTLKFYLSNAGFQNVNPGDLGRVSVTFGTETQLTDEIQFLGVGNQEWKEITMEFYATSNIQDLIFSSVLVSGKITYMAIDGIRMTYESDSNNHAPFASDDGNILLEGGVTAGNVLSNDTDDDNDILQLFSIIKLPDNGSLATNSDGEYVYQHNGSETFSDLFTYVVTDGECTDTADVVLSITPVNDPPIVVKDTFYVNEGDTLTVLNSDVDLIINNDIDPDNLNSELRAILVIPPAYNQGGIFQIGNRGAFQYIHNCNDADVDIFQYDVFDGSTRSILQDSVIIFILNEAPFGEPDYYSVEFGETLNIDELSGALSNDLDSNSCDVLTVNLIKPPSYHLGSFTLESTGAFTYIHDGSLTPSEDYFVYQLSDGEDNAIETDTVFITINNPGPNTQTFNFAVDEGKELVVDSAQGILSASSGNLNLPITAEIHQLPFRGTLLPSNSIDPNGSFVYKHDCSDTPNEDYFLFKVKDSLTETIDTVHITINNVCPTGQNDFYKISEGQTIDISSMLGVLFNDSDDNSCDPLTASIVTPPLYHVGGFTLNSDGSFVYTHDDSENFTDQFSYRLSDGECSGAVYTVTLSVDSVDDKPPLAIDDSYIPCIKEGETLDITTYGDGVLGNDTDPDVKDDTLQAILIDDVSHGTLTFNDDGTFSYTHNGNEETVDYFTYIAFDGDFNSLDTALVTLCIDQVNDCPVAVDDIFFINEGFVLDSTVARNDTDGDVDTDDNNYAVITPPAIGTLELRSDGSFTYTPPNQIAAPGPEMVTFQYEITDPDPSTSCSTTATVTIRVNSINDCPVAVDDTIFVDALSNDLIIKDLIANDYDKDNPLDSSSIFILDPPLYGDLTVNNDGTITYDYIGSPSKRDSITYAVQDSVGCISNYAKILINIENIQFPEYELPSYFTPNSDRFNDFFTVKCKNITIENVKFEVKIVDRYQRIVYESISNTDIIWDGSDQSTAGEADKGIYFYEITPVEYDDVRARTIVGVLFLDR